MKIPHYARHLLHRRCRWCYEAGHAAGFLAAAVESQRRELLIKAGLDPDDLERIHRKAIADGEAWTAA